MFYFHINSRVGTLRATFLCKVHQLCSKNSDFHVKMLQVLQIMKKSFSFINEKPVCTDCTSYLMENSFSEKVSKGATIKRINMVSHFE
jgi:thiaminase